MADETKSTQLTVKKLQYENTDVLVEVANKALQAKADASGNIIVDTYAAKTSRFHASIVTELPTTGDAYILYLLQDKTVATKFTPYVWVTEGVTTATYQQIASDISSKLDKLTTTGTSVYSHTGETQGELAVDTTSGGTSGSASLITSGAVNAGLSGKVNTTDIVNNVTSTDTDKPLAANQGKVLQDEIDNLKAIGRYLSTWDSTTGKPGTDPTSLPYAYHSGDYYIVSKVKTTDEEKNYKPTGSSYTGAASTTEETETVKVNDYYRYDGSVWQLEINTKRDTTWGSITGDLSSQTDLNTALTGKAPSAAAVLTQDLKTYYNIGKVTNASGTNPVTIGTAGQTVLDVLKNLTQMDELQPTKTDPSISSFTLSSSASDEYGTQITSVSYSVSTNNGKYTYDSSTGVTWSKFAISGGCAAVEKTTASGTLTLTNTYTVGTSSAVSFSVTGTHSAGNVAKTNLGNDSDPVVQISAGTKDGSGSFSKTSALYPYYMLSDDTTKSEIAQNTATKSTSAACTSSGVSLTAAANTYVWFFLPSTYTQKTIQYEALGQWYDWSGGTEAVQTVKITFDSGGVKSDYKAYRTSTKMAAGTTKFRIVA